MTYNPVVTLVDATGLPTQSTPTTLIALPSAAVTAGNTGTSFSTTSIQFLAVDTNVTAFTGGTSPTVQFFVDRLGADGVWYNVWSGQTVGSPAKNTFDLGPGFATNGPPNGSQHAVFTQTARFGWTFVGAPTSITFSASVVGR